MHPVTLFIKKKKSDPFQTAIPKKIAFASVMRYLKQQCCWKEGVEGQEEVLEAEPCSQYQVITLLI